MMTGREMKKRRHALECTQDAIAKVGGVSRQTINAYENGNTSTLNADAMRRIAAYLQQPMGDMPMPNAQQPPTDTRDVLASQLISCANILRDRNYDLVNAIREVRHLSDQLLAGIAALERLSDE